MASAGQPVYIVQQQPAVVMQPPRYTPNPVGQINQPAHFSPPIDGGYIGYPTANSRGPLPSAPTRDSQHSYVEIVDGQPARNSDGDGYLVPTSGNESNEYDYVDLPPVHGAYEPLVRDGYQGLRKP